jgi:hypothetical protein
MSRSCGYEYGKNVKIAILVRAAATSLLEVGSSLPWQMSKLRKKDWPPFEENRVKRRAGACKNTVASIIDRVESIVLMATIKSIKYIKNH